MKQNLGLPTTAKKLIARSHLKPLDGNNVDTEARKKDRRISIANSSILGMETPLDKRKARKSPGLGDMKRGTARKKSISHGVRSAESTMSKEKGLAG
jgi:hypothetical protein